MAIKHVGGYPPLKLGKSHKVAHVGEVGHENYPMNQGKNGKRPGIGF
jgi:hypothetical protein